MKKNAEKTADPLPEVPTRGRLIDFVTDDKQLVSAIVARVYEDNGAVQMHLSALDPVFGNRNYFVSDAIGTHRPTLGNPELQSKEALDQEAATLEPGTWSWPQRQ